MHTQSLSAFSLEPQVKIGLTKLWELHYKANDEILGSICLLRANKELQVEELYELSLFN